VTRRPLAAAVIVAIAALAACGDPEGGPTPGSGDTSPTASAGAPTAAELVVRAHRFTTSAAAESLLGRQEVWTAECMRRAGFAYAPVTPPPARPATDAVDYGLVDHFLGGGQDRENAATLDALDPTDALAWRTALDGPPRSMEEDRPATDDPAVGGCGPVALAALVGVTEAAAVADVVGTAAELAAEAQSDPEVRRARAERVECLRGSGIVLSAEEVAVDVEPFPVVRDWVDATLPGWSEQAATERRRRAAEPAVAPVIEALRDRERSLRTADRRCGDRAEEDRATEAALGRRAADLGWDAARRRAASGALDAVERAAG